MSTICKASDGGLEGQTSGRSGSVQVTSTSVSNSNGTLQVNSNIVKIVKPDGEPSKSALNASVLATSITAQVVNCSQCSETIADLTEDIQLRDQAIRDLRAEILHLNETQKGLQNELAEARKNS